MLLEHLLMFVQRQLNLRNHAVVEVRTDAEVLQVNAIQNLVAAGKLQRTTHRWCSWGVKDGQGRPSARSVTVLSTLRLPDQCHCQCGTPAGQHCYDGRKAIHGSTRGGPPQWRAEMDAMTRLGVTALADLVLKAVSTEVGTQPEYKMYDRDDDQEQVPQHGDAKVSALHYPTDQREREKQQEALNKAKGIEKVVQKRKQIVEQHWDDCGSDLSAIGCIDYDEDEEVPEEEDTSAYMVDVDYEWELAVDQVYVSSLIAKSSVAPPSDQHSRGSRYYYRTLSEFFASHRSQQRDGRFTDVLQIGSGQRTSGRFIVHRRYNRWRNFYILVDFDADDDAEVSTLGEYISWYPPHLLIAVPGKDATALGRVCGRLAQRQVDKRRHFMLEQNCHSRLHWLAEWRYLYENVAVHYFQFDGCDWWTSNGALAELMKRAPERRSMEVDWSAVNLAMLAIGVARTCLCDEHMKFYPFFPSAASGSDAPAEPAAPPEAAALPEVEGARPIPVYDPATGIGRCPGCTSRFGTRINVSKADVRHNRVPNVCRYPLDEEWTGNCPACRCIPPKARADPGHTLEVGDCRWATAPRRAGAEQGLRRGRHPRDPRVMADQESTAGLRVQAPRQDHVDAERGEAAEAAAAAAQRRHRLHRRQQ